MQINCYSVIQLSRFFKMWLKNMEWKRQLVVLVKDYLRTLRYSTFPSSCYSWIYYVFFVCFAQMCNTWWVPKIWASKLVPWQLRWVAKIYLKLYLYDKNNFYNSITLIMMYCSSGFLLYNLVNRNFYHLEFLFWPFASWIHRGWYKHWGPTGNKLHMHGISLLN